MGHHSRSGDYASRDLDPCWRGRLFASGHRGMTGDPLVDIRDALADIAARMVTRDDLQREISGIRDDLHKEVSGIRDDLQREISGVRDDLHKEVSGVRDELRQEIIRTRSEIMSRIDRLQDAVALQHEERIVDIGSSERAERLAKAAQQDAAAIGEIVTPLVRLVHGMRTQLDDLAEQVRILKERPPAA
jgi:hypothetical protein